MSKTEYAAYLASDHWREIRKETFGNLTPTCERCSIPRWLSEIVYDQDLHVHHVTYANLGSERPEDLEVLCRRCHEIETFGRSGLKQLKQTECAVCGSVHWDTRSELCPLCVALFRAPFHLSKTVDSAVPGFSSARDSVLWQLAAINRDAVIQSLTTTLRKLEELDRSEIPF